MKAESCRFPVIAAAFAAMSAASPASADTWEWIAAPYLWAPSVATDLKTRTPPDGGISTDTKFSDIVDKLDGAFQMRFEGQGDRLGFFADITYLGLSDSRSHPRFELDSDLDTRLFDAALVWSPGTERFSGLELFGGLRYIDVDVNVRFDPINPAFDPMSLDAGESFADALVGARYGWRFTDRWSATVRGDLSFGDTEGTWNASLIGSYRTGNGAWYFGYRHMAVEIDTSHANTDVTFSGPIVGYGFRF